MTLVTLMLTALLSHPGQQAPAPASRREVVQEGIAVELEMENLSPDAVPAQLQEGDDVTFRFRVRDTLTGQLLSGLYPAAWMAWLADDETPEPTRCVRKVEEFIGGSLFAQAEVDLNVYYVLALNDDATVTVVDPLFGFGGTRLLAMIGLPAPGEDWILSRDHQHLFVTVPAADRVTVVDNTDWQVVGHVTVGPRPRRIVAQPDGGYLWVSFGEGERGGVVAIDPRHLEVMARIATGAGPHEMAFTDDSRSLLVANRGAGTVSVIDPARLEKVRDVATGEGPVSVAYSPLAEAFYVSHADAGTVVVLDARRHRILSRIKAEPGLGQIRVAPDGRLALVVNPGSDTLHVIDIATQRIVQTGRMKRGPTQITFSDELAYVLHAESEIVLMIPLDELGEPGQPVPVVDFPGGQRPFGDGRRPSPAAALVQAPGDTAVLVANPADQLIYYYKEGMAAPMGSFRNYEREPRAVLVVDRSLRERRQPGVYETSAKLRRPGRYEIAFYLDTPRIVHCFTAEVQPNPELEEQRRRTRPFDVEYLSAPRAVVGEATPVRFRLIDPVTGRPAAALEDVRVLIFTAGSWQRRAPAAAVGDGIYQVSFVLPEAGTYLVSVESRAARLPFNDSPQLTLRAGTR